MAMMAGVAGAQNPNTTDTQDVRKSQAQPAATGSSKVKPAAGAPAKTQAAPATATKPATTPANAAKPTVKPALAPASAAKPPVKPATASASTAKPAVQVAAAPAAKGSSAVPSAPAKGPATPKTQIPAAKAVFAARPPAAQPTPKALPAPATAKVAGKGSKPAATIAAKPVIDANKKPVIDANKKSDPRKSAGAGKTSDATKQAKPEEKKWSMTGKRDPFFSPVVSQIGGSGCSTGKKCLEIGQINLRGVVKSENGFIAVVTNTLNKAYFLREKDPVFNGYVVRITGDSVVFQETVQDKLGKAFTREVVKRIFTPAV